jgi:hypothetical protein
MNLQSISKFNSPLLGRTAANTTFLLFILVVAIVYVRVGELGCHGVYDGLSKCSDGGRRGLSDELGV